MYVNTTFSQTETRPVDTGTTRGGPIERFSLDIDHCNKKGTEGTKRSCYMT